MKTKTNISLHYRMKDHLGSGQFGTVYSGMWNKSVGTDSDYEVGEVLKVAVKSMKSGASEEERTKFLQEAAIMGQFKNPYILQILGYMTGDPVSLLTIILGSTVRWNDVHPTLFAM